MGKITLIIVAVVSASAAWASPVKPLDATPPIFDVAPSSSYGDAQATSQPTRNSPVQPQRNVYEQREDSYDDGPAKYAFDFAVLDPYSSLDFTHKEDRDGYKIEGSYYVALPDGRTQKVTYYVDGDSGYVAEVSYEGEAQYPEPETYKT